MLNKVKKIFVMFSVALCAFMTIGCDDVKVEKIASEAKLTTTTVKGTSTNCAVVLRAQQGTAYSVAIKSEGDWATFTGGVTALTDTMTTVDKVIYIYFDKNSSGKERSAEVSVEFSDGNQYTGYFTQLSYDTSVAMEREWAELPVCKNENDYIFNTHYGKLGIKDNARNYSYCFDPSVRASLWVAYPLHSSHMSGEGDRDYSSFGYDPMVSTSDQANLYKSYNGWYDRGHQIPAADRKCSQEMMDQTFYATNMTPQQGNFNQNKWGVLEGRVRNMVCSDTLYVVTGAYFDGEHDSSIESQTTDRSGNVCPTPTYYYKALLRTKKGNTGLRIDEVKDANAVRGIVFWLKHANTGESTSITNADCISISELEEKTGFTFFPMLDDSIEEKVKSTIVPSEWGVN